MSGKGGLSRIWSVVFLTIGLAFFVAALVAVYVWPRSTSFVRTGQTFEQSAVILTQTQNILVMVGIFLTVVTIVGTVAGVAWTNYSNRRLLETQVVAESAREKAISIEKEWISKQSQMRDDLAEQGRKFDNEIGAFAAQKEALERIIRLNLIAVADMVAASLPRVTFSQQIPIRIVAALSPMYTAFYATDEGHELLRFIDEKPNGARVRYALALHILGRSADDDERRRAIALLMKASRRTGERDLRTDVLVRLFQALRQERRTDAAEKCLQRVRDIRGEGASALATWGSIVLSLQQAFAADEPKERLQFFERAMTEALRFQKALNSRTAEVDGAIAYYCAKACWAYLLASDAAPDDDSPAKRLLKVAAKITENKIEQQLSFGIDDELVRAIYYSSLAYVRIAASEPSSPVAKGDIKRDIEQAERLVDRADDRYVIYSDHLEMLASLGQFRTYLRDLREFVDEPTKLRSFYREGAAAIA